MSIVPACAYDDSRLKPGHIRTLGLIGTYADRGGWCYPARETLAVRTGVNVAQIDRDIRMLIKYKYLEKHPQRRSDGRLHNALRLNYRAADTAIPFFRLASEDDDGPNDPPGISDSDPPRISDSDPLGISDSDPLGISDSDPLGISDSDPFEPSPRNRTTHRNVEYVLHSGDPSFVDVLQQQQTTAAAAVENELIELLESEGIDPVAAKQLVAKYPERVEHQIALARANDAAIDFRNLGGWLRWAIENDWQPPRRLAAAEPAPLVNVRSVGAGQQLDEQLDLPPLPAEADVWERAKRQLTAEMRPAMWQQWVEPVRLHQLDAAAGLLTLHCPDQRVARYLEERLRPAVESALRAATGRDLTLRLYIPVGATA